MLCISALFFIDFLLLNVYILKNKQKVKVKKKGLAMLKNNFVQISDRLTETFMEKRVYFNNYDNGVILISTSRGDYQAEDHLCEAISALIAENLNLRVAGNSVISSSLGIDGALIIFEKKD